MLVSLTLPARAASDSPLIAAPPAWVKARALPTHAGPPADQLRQGTDYLLSDQQVKVEGRDKQHYRHFAMKALNEKGVEAIANIEIRFDPSFETLTLHSIMLRRGTQTLSKLRAGAVRVLQREKELDALIFDGSRTAHVFLEDVRVGDTVEYAYTVRGSNPVFDGSHFGQFDLQWVAPVQQVYARLLWPADRPLHLQTRNTAMQVQVQEIGGLREHEWQASQLPGLAVSNEAPAWYDPYPVVQWGEFKDWAAVAQWAVPLYQVPATIGGELRAELARIAAAHQAPQERLVEALRFVQQTVRYLGVEVGAGSHAPSAPATVLARRFGDCKDKTLLTVTMLRALGIEAWPALVHTQLRRGIAARQPSPGAFNHVLVLARVAGRDYWVDPTKPSQRGRLDLISQSNHGLALVVDAATSALRPMPTGEATQNRRRIQAVLDASEGLDKPVRYTVTTVTQGRSAEVLRAALAGSNADELQKTYLNFYAQSYPGVKLDQRFSVSEDEAANRVTVVERYLIEDFWGEAEDKAKRLEAHVRVPEMKSYLGGPREAIRQAPLALEHPVDIEHVTELRLPEDWTAKSETTRVEDPAFEFERKTVATPRLLTFTDRFRSLADEVSAADTPRYVANLERAREALGYQLTKTLGPQSEPAWSDRFNWSVAVAGLAMAGLWLRLALWVYRRDPATAQPQEGLPLGGWLILLGLGVLISPLLLLKQFWPLLDAYTNQAWALTTMPDGSSYHPLMAPLQLLELAVFLGRLLFCGLLIVMFLQRRRGWPQLFVIVTWTAWLSSALDLLLAAAIPSLTASVTSADWSELARQLFFMVIWTVYLNQSSRVRDTFVRLRRPPPAASCETPPTSPPLSRPQPQLETMA